MILCAGESLVDVVPQADGSRLALPGGAVFNTALGLGRLGADVAYLWPLSTDDHGRRLRALLDGAGVDTGPCPATDLPTASAEVTLSDGNATYVFHLVGTTATALTPQPLPAAARALFIGGISLAIEPAATAIETLATDAARAGLTVMIDPNLRPGLIDDPEALRARLDRLLAVAAIVKLSSDDLDWLSPGMRPEAAARALADRTGALVLHTQGGDGAALLRAGAAPLYEPALPVEVVDTIGAGDSFNAGVLAALQAAGALDDPAHAAPETLARAVRHGIKVAAATVGRQGADPPWARDLPAEAGPPAAG
ncbi:carbohydrate kinase family protein [Paracoccus aeridis]|uniref:carbohydrate kinase family protein n=1 Tax=Paracoccus aeridis TaxID=1966466 RepID=UPI0010AAAAE8|nr:carbohydrate kinase [Paracoccus aeridis]